jgi:hypothetical protein
MSHLDGHRLYIFLDRRSYLYWRKDGWQLRIGDDSCLSVSRELVKNIMTKVTSIRHQHFQKCLLQLPARNPS